MKNYSQTFSKVLECLDITSLESVTHFPVFDRQYLMLKTKPKCSYSFHVFNSNRCKMFLRWLFYILEKIFRDKKGVKLYNLVQTICNYMNNFLQLFLKSQVSLLELRNCLTLLSLSTFLLYSGRSFIGSRLMGSFG
jgi:hypothetical protein